MMETLFRSRVNVFRTSLGLLPIGALLGLACSSAPTPFVVRGPESPDSDPPTLTFLEPINDLTITQGTRFVIRWTDSDRDSNASIEFQLARTDVTTRISLVQGLPENDDVGLDSVSIGTSAVPPGEYNLLGIIRDEVSAVEIYAMTEGATVPQRIAMTIVPQGTGPLTVPPRVTVTQPNFNLSVAQDDFLNIAVQPSLLVPDPVNPVPFDPDSQLQMFILLDLDQDPNNDDPANDEEGIDDGIIVLQQRTVGPEEIGPLTFNIKVELKTIPSREGGAPYFIRATADDLSNPRVHQYASGQISVVELASGLVDLSEIGKTTAGARFYGFNPGANTGSSIASIGDFDGDGVEDFILVAQFGNPRNFGLVGEAYLIYGQNRIRFGGSIPVNSVSESISGVIFEGPPIRLRPGGRLLPGTPRSDGITSVSFIRDLSGDGRPEILFGLPHVHGAIETQDFDPSDEDPTQDSTEDVAVTITQGRVTTAVNDGIPSVSNLYSGLNDTTISSATPGNTAGSSAELTWRNDPGANVTEWGLIKYGNLLENIPDSDQIFLIDFGSIDASLDLRVFNPGGPATLHLLLTDFTEQTTFNNFANGRGGPPVAGTDYFADPVGTIDADTAELVNVDISDLIRLLLGGVLAPQNNELRFIIVPSADEGANQSGIRSSETNIVFNRPVLNLTYTRTNIFGSAGCYPDAWANNETDPEAFDDYFYAGDMAVLFNSQNRDNDPRSNQDVSRLDTTSVSLELVGQETGRVLDGSDLNQTSGGIFARADNVAADVLGGEAEEFNRISGARFVAGWFDYIDHRALRQGPREGLFGQTVASIGDLNNDGLDEIVISAPNNEQYLDDLAEAFGTQSTQRASTAFTGSIVVIPGNNYNDRVWRDKDDDESSTSSIPVMFQHRFPPGYGNCTPPAEARYGPIFPADTFEVFAENPEDRLGQAQSAGDFNQDGLDDILCGAYLNDRTGGRTDSGAAYILYGRNVLGDFRLENANDLLLRPPMLRIRGVRTGDQIGWRQSTGLDVNGDRLNDVFIASPRTDYGGITRGSCGGDFTGDGVVDEADFADDSFDACRALFERREQDLFSDDDCKVFDYDNDFDLDDDDDRVVTCLRNRGSNCCANLVDNGFVGIIFGGVFTDGDRDITQIATPDLPGAIFYGSGAGFRAGFDVSSAGDFNQDGFGDLLIVAPGETRIDRAGRPRLGVVYLVFGGTHLTNTVWNLAEVGSEDLAGIVFLSPYVTSRPNEAPPMSVAFLGDVNQDGFGDICIGNPRADFIDLSFPQGPDAPNLDAAVGRRRNAGDAYLVYGNNFGSNRSTR